jgi:hypothetical protein
VAGVHHYGRKSFARVFNSPGGRARAEQTHQTQGKSKTDRSPHPDSIAKNSFSTKSFSLILRRFVGRLCQTPIFYTGVSQKRPTI